MAKKADELIEKAVVSKRGRPRKTDAEKKKTTKKNSKKSTSKKSKTLKVSKAIKNDVVEQISDASLDIPVAIPENVSIELPTLAQQPRKKRTIKNISAKKSSNKTAITKKATKNGRKRTLSLSLPKTPNNSTSVNEEYTVQEPENYEVFEETIVEAPENILTQEQPQEPTETQKIISPEKKIQKKKRTLKLNSSFTQKPEIQEKPQTSLQEEILETPFDFEQEVTINQNSSFFNSPSVFTKFNIDFTSTELEELQEKETEGLNDLIDSSTLSDTTKLLEFFKNTIKTPKVEDVYDFVSTEDSNSTETSSQDPITEEYDFISNEINNSIYASPSIPNIEDNDTSLEIELDDTNTTSSIIDFDNEILSEITLEETDCINSQELEIEDNEENTTEIIDEISDNFISESIEELTDNDIFEELLNSDDLLDTEFFDTSIIDINDIEISPEDESVNNISENIINESDSPQKESATNIIEEHLGEKIEYIADKTPVGKFIETPSFTSSIFKKFSFEEANLATIQNNDKIYNTTNITIQPEINLSTIQNSLENFTQISQESPTPTASAEPTSTINIPTIEQVIPTAITLPVEKIDDYIDMPSSLQNDFYENGLEDDLEDNLEDNLEDDFDDPENYQFSNKLINRLSEEEFDDSDDIDNIANVDNINLENDDENVDMTELENITKKLQEIDYENITSEDLEKLQEPNYNDDTFSIESYFGIEKLNNNTTSKNIEKLNSDTIIENNDEDSLIIENNLEENNFAEKFLNANKAKSEEHSVTSTEVDDNIEITDLNIEDIDITDFDLDILEDSIFEESENSEETEISEDNIIENSFIEEELENVFEDFSESTSQELDSSELNIDDIDINDFDLDDFEDLDISTSTETLNSSEKSVESIISEAFLSKDFSLDTTLTNKLLQEVNSDKNDTNNETIDAPSDFLQIINSLTKAITELEQTPDVNSEVYEKPKQTLIQESKKEEKMPISSIDLPTELITNTHEDKAINILINKDDIFSISILNETYEIVADFDGISVLSENIHISTPKNNFFVKVGNKYIEIHNKESHFILNTNFEDIEFANAINNITFAKKDNKIELNIKEAFKVSSVNNKIEVSMLNKAIADLSSTSNTSDSSNDDSSSICDNKTLLISEETQKVYLPYTIEDVMKKLKTTDDYQTLQEVIDNEYTLPLSTFKMPIISRFKEAYRFMRTKENSSVYAAVDLALELMFNSNLNPAVIRAAKDLKELNIYLDCLYENEVEKFDCFKIIYKVLPKIK